MVGVTESVVVGMGNGFVKPETAHAVSEVVGLIRRWPDAVSGT